MSIATICLFFIYTYGLGFSMDFFLKGKYHSFERHSLRLGLGLAAFSFIGVLFGLIGIPLDWRLFLALSLAIPVYSLIKGKFVLSFSTPKLTKSNLFALIVLLLALCTLGVYNKGSFSYPWLEDDDPWNHAIGIKYVSVEKAIPPADTVQYMNPYPPAYGIIMGILHQTSPSIKWTMSFFNNLIIALSILFFYFFVTRFTNKKTLALFSTFVLFSIPSYLSHFIWAHSLVVTLFIVALYCLVRSLDEKKWIVASVLTVASTWLVQPTQPLKFLVLYLAFVLVYCLTSRKIKWNIILGVIGGYVLSLIWWFNHYEGMIRAQVGGSTGSGLDSGQGGQSFLSFIQAAFPQNSGTATRAYSFQEIFFAQHTNMINNPIGIGAFVSFLIIIGILGIFLMQHRGKLKEHSWMFIAIICAILTFLGFNSVTFNLPVGFFGFRFWMLFALFGSILAGIGFESLLSIFKRYKLAVVAIVIAGVILTSAHQKYSVNTAVWPAGLGWNTYNELQDYAWLSQNLPMNTPIFTFYQNGYVLGFDMYSCEWCKDSLEYRKTSINQSPTDLHQWLNQKEYQYVLIDQRAVRKFGLEMVNEKVQGLLDSRLFSMVHSTQTLVLLRVA